MELIYVDKNFSFGFYVLCFLWRACSTHSTGVGISSPSPPCVGGGRGAYGGTNSPPVRVHAWWEQHDQLESSSGKISNIIQHFYLSIKNYLILKHFCRLGNGIISLDHLGAVFHFEKNLIVIAQNFSKTWLTIPKCIKKISELYCFEMFLRESIF